MDTGRRKLGLRREWLPKLWSKDAVATGFTLLLAAGNEPMKVAKVILLQVRLGDLTVKIWLRVVKLFAVKVVLGT